MHEVGDWNPAEEHSHSHEHEHVHTHPHEHSHEHMHDHEHHDEHEYAHEHSHEHGHTHSHAHTKAVLNRLSRAIGHLEYVKRMVEDGQDCSEVLIQLAAVRSALNNTGKLILTDHIEHCIVDAMEEGDREPIERLTKAVEQFIK